MKPLERPGRKSSARRLARGAVVAATAGALVWLAVTAGAQGSPSGTTRLVADEGPGYAVEDFDYPQADKILAEQGITLKRGDGHIVLADCASETGLLEVWARQQDKICFRMTGDSGWLTMEIPSVYGVKGNDYTTQVDMTVGTEEKTFDIAKNSWTPVGESADEQGREHMLVEIRSSK
ncbi:hypothetical protein [Streptomyces meridianus]|uniref:Secreted protein n=1 Tax=Streptomyces meridianus TaxID=2938945 RepID=A0ABT0X9A1_9ACTN|nr:hypothetical protein [Streptomyces meridianus]MCM2579118.1 hypothetical protein [Streptomyces meridianus]